MEPTVCPWCADPTEDEYSDGMCRLHEAEYEGTSVAGLDYRDSEWAAEMS